MLTSLSVCVKLSPLHCIVFVAYSTYFDVANKTKCKIVSIRLLYLVLWLFQLR